MVRRKHLISAFFWGSLILTLVAWWNRNTFPEELPSIPQLAEEPLQSPVRAPSFTAQAEGVTYRIKPLYDYELTGLVVSFKRFTPGIGLHERWQDYLNIADLCVVWGSNATDVDLNAFTFWNLEFTCNFKTSDRDAWQRFNQDALSNNHLLSTDPRIHNVIDDLRVGDVVRLKGKLVEYGQPGTPFRGTSTTRTDRGNGACETLFVEQATIVSSMESGWRLVLWLGIIGLVLSLVLWFTTPHDALH